MALPAEQAKVGEFLQQLAGAPPIETHISAVFVGSDTVWKLKKAVRLPFVDFTALSERERLLKRELALNRPAAPGLYRDVVAVRRRPDGALALDDDRGDEVDWVLRMARVPRGDFLETIVAEHRLTDDLLREIADNVAAYHASLPPAALDQVTALHRVAEGNVASALAAGLPSRAVEAWRQGIMAALAARAVWLAARGLAGFVRRAHGDLHLGNLCLWQGRPVPFDALEFDEDMATIDLGYDLAFLLMDLDQTVDRRAANLVLNRYVARSGDAALVAGLPAFLSLRAMVRAHVRQSAGAAGADAYLAAAQTYLTPAAPLLLAVGGLQGTGKSTLALAVAPELGGAPGALVLRSDEIRKRLHGAAPEDRLPPGAYDAAANRATDAALLEAVEAALAGGHAVVADATFLDLGLRAKLAAVAQHAGVRFLGVWLQAPLAVLEARIGGRVGDASDATVAVLRDAAARDPGPGDWRTVDATNRATALARLRALL
jgi:aminoglycoside phosphotransferase family enzyme/predicted kinase